MDKNCFYAKCRIISYGVGNLDKTAAYAAATIIGFIVLFSVLAVIFLFPSTAIQNPGVRYNDFTQNAAAARQGSTLIIFFTYVNHGSKSLTLERFYLEGSNGTSTSTSGTVPQQNIPGLTITFNGTTTKNPNNIGRVFPPQNSLMITITVPNYTRYVAGTYVNVDIVEQGIVEGLAPIAIS